MSENVVKLGIVGLNGMGGVHASRILSGLIPRLKITALCDLNEKVLEPYKEQKDIALFSDSSKMIHSGVIDAILIATPHFFHSVIGIEALQAGLHVLVEKPISVHKAEAERLIAARINEEQIFCGMFNLRTEPHYMKIHSMLTKGELGRITRINWITTKWFRSEAYYAAVRWRATWKGEGGGVLVNQCTHQLDLWAWLFGMPKTVRANCYFGKYHDIEVEDEVTAFMEYEDGVTGVFIATTGEAPGTNRLEITGERGKLIFENSQLKFTRNEIDTSEYSNTTDLAFGEPECWDIIVPCGENSDQHRVILQNFTDAILDGKQLLAPAEEGIKAVELANSFLYSSLINQTVELPLDSVEFEKIINDLIENSDGFEKKKVRTDVKSSLKKSFNKL